MKPVAPRKTRSGAKKVKGVKSCPMCKAALRPRQKYCNDACKARAFRKRKEEATA